MSAFKGALRETAFQLAWCTPSREDSKKFDFKIGLCTDFFEQVAVVETSEIKRFRLGHCCVDRKLFT